MTVRYVSPYNGRVVTKQKVRETDYDWEALELEFLECPDLSIVEFAEHKGIPIQTLRAHADPIAGAWVRKRKGRFLRIRQENEKRLSDILHETKRDDLSAFKALEDRLKKVVLSSLELLFPPEDAPMEAHLSARNRLESMSARQLSEIINTGMRTLTETGRHRRLLSGQSTAIFARAEAPDIMLPIPLEEARMLEMRSRMAQSAMIAIDEGVPLDVDYAVIASREDSPVRVPPDFADV